MGVHYIVRPHERSFIGTASPTLTLPRYAGEGTRDLPPLSALLCGRGRVGWGSARATAYRAARDAFRRGRRRGRSDRGQYREHRAAATSRAWWRGSTSSWARGSRREMPCPTLDDRHLRARLALHQGPAREGPRRAFEATLADTRATPVRRARPELLAISAEELSRHRHAVEHGGASPGSKGGAGGRRRRGPHPRDRDRAQHGARPDRRR